MFTKIISIALGGAAGAMARYGLAGLVQKRFSMEFPLGTISVNLAGCLGFGILWTVFMRRMDISLQLRTGLLIGFFGAFTTFSTYMFETAQMLRDGQFLAAFGNFAIQNVLGFLFLLLGFSLGKMI